MIVRAVIANVVICHCCHHCDVVKKLPFGSVLLIAVYGSFNFGERQLQVTQATDISLCKLAENRRFKGL